MMKAVQQLLMACVLGIAASGAWASGGLQVRDPWVQAAPPNAKVMAAYLEINNSGKKPRVLVSAASPAFDQVGIHRTMMHGNMAHMEHLKELSLPPRAATSFKPGGLHLMLMDPKKPLRTGDQVSITLVFKDGEKITFMAAVRSGQLGDAQNNQHMDHSSHGSHKH